MLRIYICPKCYNFRMVSRKPDAICFHCGTVLDQCDIDYSEYINMTEEQRNKYKEQYQNRMKAYYEKMELLNQEDNIPNKPLNEKSSEYNR